MERVHEVSAHLTGTWTYEVAALLTSIASLAALVGVLVAADGQRIMTWHDLTLNTLVSILSTISRLGALYVFSSTIGQTKWNVFSKRPGSLLEFEAIDMASRGPVGCLLLLFGTRNIAFLGCLAVLIAVAFDPFAQQLVQLRSNVVYTQNENVTMPVAQGYAAGSIVYEAGDYDRDIGLRPANLVETPLGMQSAVLNGLIQSNFAIDSQLPLQCPSGNCTWDAVTSLAVCSVCNNVTSALQLLPPTGNNIPAAQILDSSYRRSGTLSDNCTSYILSDYAYFDNSDSGPHSDFKRMAMTAYGTGNASRTTSLQDVDTLIWSMGIIQAEPHITVPHPTGDVYGETPAKWPEEFKVKATECGLYYCVKEYNVNVTNNKVTSNSTEIKTAKRDPESWQYLNGAGEGLSDSAKQALYFTGVVNDSSLRPLGDERSDLVLQDGTNIYNITPNALLTLSYYMNQTFNMQNNTRPFNVSALYHPRDAPGTNARSLGGYFITNIPPPGLKSNYRWDYFQNQSQPNVMQALQTSSSLDDTFAALAASMSNSIRTEASGSKLSSGMLGELVVTYSISWLWIILPAIVVIASFVELCLTMISSRNRPKWKNSTLATLSRGPFVGESFYDSRTVNDLRVAAGKAHIHLFDKSGEYGQDDAMKDGETTERVKHVPPFEAAAMGRDRDNSRDTLLT